MNVTVGALKPNFANATTAASAGIALSVGLGAMLGHSPRAGLILLAGVCALPVYLLARTFPRFSAHVAVASFTLVPFFGFPALFGFVLHPGIVFLTGAALLVVIRPAEMLSRWTLLDSLVVVYLAGLAASVAQGVQTTGYLLYVSCLIVGPYFGARALTRLFGIELLMRSLAIAGLLASPFVVVEILGANPFRELFPYVAAADLADGAGGLGSVVTRLDTTRAQGAFGQPIPFAIAMATCALAALAVWSTSQTRARAGWLIVAGVCVAAQAAALARSGWLVLLVAAVVAFALAPRQFVRSRNVTIFIVLGLAVGASFATPQVRALLFGGGSASEQQKLEASANYRDQLFDEALSPGVIQPFGSTDKFRTYLDTGSIDNAYIEVGFHWGWLPLLALLGIVVAVARVAVLARRQSLTMVVVVAALAGTLFALWNVAFIAQQTAIFWLLLGCLSGAQISATTDYSARRRATAASRLTQTPNLPPTRAARSA